MKKKLFYAKALGWKRKGFYYQVDNPRAESYVKEPLLKVIGLIKKAKKVNII